jgi:hypothetical protein
VRRIGHGAIEQLAAQRIERQRGRVGAGQQVQAVEAGGDHDHRRLGQHRAVGGQGGPSFAIFSGAFRLRAIQPQRGHRGVAKPGDAGRRQHGGHQRGGAHPAAAGVPVGGAVVAQGGGAALHGIGGSAPGVTW